MAKTRGIALWRSAAAPYAGLEKREMKLSIFRWIPV
jgi:hypothetical protein